MKRLDGKLALVTGAAQGIGEAIAREFAAEGARVLLTDINEDGASQAAAGINAEYGNGTAYAARHDVTSEQDWAAAIDAASAELGGLSILVNNAGIAPIGSVEDISLEQWHKCMSINVDSVFLGCKAALPLMRNHQPASIVNMSSIAGLIAAHNLASYNASKAAVWLLTKSVALHCAHSGWDIRCNSVHPTFVKTPILEQLVASGDREAILTKLTRQVPLKRLGETIDIAKAAVYLASDESRFMTGAEMKLDGGISAM